MELNREIPIVRYTSEEVARMGTKQIIGILQNIIGQALSSNNDRNQNRSQHVTEYLKRAHDLCIRARERWKP